MSGLFNIEYPYTDFHELNLSWVIKKIKELLERMTSIENWKDEYQDTYDKLKALYDDLVAGRYPPEFVKNLSDWIGKYGVDIIMKLIKMVFFGITNDGYFVAYVPDSWDEIVFGTSGLDDFPADTDFGHLTLSFQITGG